MTEFWLKQAAKILVALVLWPVLLGISVLIGHHIEWWAAGLAALVVAFIGWDVVVAIVISFIFDDFSDD